MDELERVFREGLERHADRADVAAPVVAGARAAAARRRTTRVVLAAAAVLVVAGAGIAVAVGGSGDDPVGVAGAPSPTGDVATDPVTTEPSVLGPTRTEVWSNVQVDVPADWQLAEVPGGCGSTPVGEPYVARPLPTSDVCGSGEQDDSTPTAPYVWLGAGGPIGSTDLGDGWIRETALVDGTAVTVASRDEAVRRAILGSARTQEICPTDVSEARARYDTTREGRGEMVAGRLCAYRRWESSTFTLVYASALDEETVTTTIDAVLRAPVSENDGACAISDVVLVSGTFADPNGGADNRLRQSARFTFPGCGASLGGLGTEVTEAAVRPWAADGTFKHLLLGPWLESWNQRYFIGTIG